MAVKLGEMLIKAGLPPWLGDRLLLGV